ncbi:hypothetical protein CPB86DRAFT_813705 [Serendipita vermifera]|nr:hypothetical protein CPB86DRAFT_813705 [Serendipita vermifera]
MQSNILDKLDVPELFFQLHVLRYMGVAAATIWAYDVLVTVDEELRLLWSTNGRLLKFLYLLNRYLPILGVYIFLQSLFVPSEGTILGACSLRIAEGPTANLFRIVSCQIVYAVSIFTQVMQTIVSTSMFTMGLRAVYCMHSSIRHTLVVCLLISHISMVTFFALTVVEVMPGVVWDAHILHVCLTPDFRKWAVGAIYIIPIAINSITFVATAFHAMRYNQRDFGFQNTSTADLLETLYVNGTIYYVIVLNLQIGTVLVFFLAPIGYQALFSYMSYSLSSTLTSRWLLSFREKVIEVHTETTNTAVSENATIINSKRMSAMSGASSGHASRRASQISTSQSGSNSRPVSRASSPRHSRIVDTGASNTVASRQSRRQKGESMTHSVRFVLDDSERRSSIRIETGGSTGRRSNRNSASTSRSVIRSIYEVDRASSCSSSNVEWKDTCSRSKLTSVVNEIIEEKDQP